MLLWTLNRHLQIHTPTLLYPRSEKTIGSLQCTFFCTSKPIYASCQPTANTRLPQTVGIGAQTIKIRGASKEASQGRMSPKSVILNNKAISLYADQPELITIKLTSLGRSFGRVAHPSLGGVVSLKDKPHPHFPYNDTIEKYFHYIVMDTKITTTKLHFVTIVSLSTKIIIKLITPPLRYQFDI